MGAAIDESFRERLAITIVATRRGTTAVKKALPEPPAQAEGQAESLLDMGEVERPQSRMVPPPPEMSAEEVRKIYAGKPGSSARTRKSQAKMSQGTLQLEIISKGRFDKSEPTIHKGEDLDVPTYIRRGVSLN